MTRSGQSLPPELLARVCEIVEQFDTAWQAVAEGARPPWIEDALRNISVTDQPAFLRELLAIDLECRRRFGEQPIVKDYAARFPKHAKLVDEVFEVFHEAQHDQASQTLAARSFVEGTGVDPQRPPTPGIDPQFADLAFSPGDVLHDYVLLEKLGKGGMGVVFKAQHSRLKKIVAIKVLLERRTSDPNAIARFQREMEAVGQLRHPHVVEAYDAGDAEGTHYLVIEYVAGMDVSTVIRSIGRSGLGSQRESEFDTGITPTHGSQSHDTLDSAPPASDPRSASDVPATQPTQKAAPTISSADACEIIRQAALGLQHAHERGLIHRDVKPSNLLLSTEGVVKVLDLGLARLQTEHLNSALTSFGMVMGTIDYISPEQVLNSHQVDARTDLYSLGCTMYHLLAGHPPYHGPEYSSAYHKMKAHEIATPPAIARQDIPSGVLAVLDKLLRKQPAERFASAEEVSAVLAHFTAGCDLIRLLDVANGAEPIASNSPMAGSAAPLTAELTEPTDLRPPYRTARRSWGLWATGAAVLVTLAVWGFKSRKNSPDSTTSPPASTSTSVSPATEESKDQDRAAAEWALSVGGEVAIQVGDNKHNIKRLADLPPGAFQITFIAFNGGDVTDDGLLNLRGLRALDDLRLTNTPRVTPQGMQVLTSLPNLHTLILDEKSFTDDHLTPLRDCPKLYWLVLSSQSMLSFTDAVVEPLTQIPELIHLNLGSTPITDEGLKRLLAAPKLSELTLIETKVTDEGLKLLANDPRWTGLSINGLQTAKSVENLGLLPNLKILDVNATCFPDASFEVSRFPKLQNLQINGGKISNQLTANLLSRIGRFRQIEALRFSFFSHADPASLTELSKLDRLTLIEFAAVPLTDEGLAQLANHPSLKQVTLRGTQVTAAGLAKFKSVRPDVKVEGDVVEPNGALDRAAAEWVLSAGGEVTIQVGDDQQKITRLADLPSGAFQTKLVAIDGGNVTDDGLLNLRGLRALNVLRLADAPQVTPKGMQLLTSLPNLLSVILDGKNFTDEHLAALRDCVRLTRLVLNTPSITDAAVEPLTQLPELVYLNLIYSPITDDGLKRLLSVPKLSELVVANTKVTDDGLKLLANDPRWKALSIGSPQTAKGVDHLGQLPNLWFLDFAAECLPDRAFDVSRFPNLQTVAVNGDFIRAGVVGQGSLTENHFARIGRFQQIESLSLGFFSQLEPAGLAELSELDRLTSIKFEAVPLTDEGLAQLANHPSLKQVTLLRTQVTAAGLAKFRAARPNVMVETDID